MYTPSSPDPTTHGITLDMLLLQMCNSTLSLYAHTIPNDLPQCQAFYLGTARKHNCMGIGDR